MSRPCIAILLTPVRGLGLEARSTPYKTISLLDAQKLGTLHHIVAGLHYHAVYRTLLNAAPAVTAKLAQISIQVDVLRSLRVDHDNICSPLTTGPVNVKEPNMETGDGGVALAGTKYR